MVHLAVLVGFYCLSLFFGSGLWLILSPAHQRRDATTLLSLGPVLGIAWVGLFLANAFSLHVPFAAASVALASTTTILNALTYWRYREDLGSQIRSYRARKTTKLLFLGLAVAFSVALLSPVLDKSWLTMPWRVGPDASGYAGTAQFLLEGHSYDGITADNIVVVDMVAREFLWAALRRGFPLTLAFYSGVLHQHPSQTAFYLAALCYLLVFLCGMRLYAIALGKGDVWATVLAGLSIGLNCNLLFVFLEGGYGQISSMALSVGILLSVFSFTRTCGKERADNTRGLLLVGLLTSAAATYYTESVFPILGVFGGYLVLSLLRSRLRWSWNFLLTPLVVFLLSPQVVGAWVAFQVGNVGNLAKGGIGWPQPQWPFVLEVLGLRNMYDAPISPQAHVIIPHEPDGHALFIAVCIALLVFAGATALFFTLKTRASQWFFLAVGLIVALHLFFRFDLNVHSYAYTKMCVFLLPLLCLGMFGFLPTHIRQAALGRGIGSLFVAIVGWNGVDMLSTYRTTAWYLSKGDVELRKVPRLQGDRVVLLMPAKNVRYMESAAVLPLLSGRYSHKDFWGAQYLFNWASNTTPVLLLRRKEAEEQPATPLASVAERSKVIWEGSEYRLLDPALAAKDVLALCAQQ